MKKLILTLLVCLLLTAPVSAETINLMWEQPCVDGCPDNVPPAGAVTGWRVYIGDASGVYSPTPIIDMPYDGTPEPSYSSTYVLTLTGAGSKFIIVTAYNETLESGYSNEVEYIYNVASPNVPVTLRFTVTP